MALRTPRILTARPPRPLGPWRSPMCPRSLALFAKQTPMRLTAPEESEDAPEGRKLFLPVFSVLTAFLVLGVVALVISLAVSIRPTVDQRPSPGEKAIAPSTAAPAPPAVQEAAPAQNPPAVQVARPALVQPAPEIIPNPVSVAQRAPRTVVVEAPAVNAQAPAPSTTATGSGPRTGGTRAGCRRPAGGTRAGCRRPAGGTRAGCRRRTDPSATGSGGNAPHGYAGVPAIGPTAAAADSGPDLPLSGARPVGAAFTVAPAVTAQQQQVPQASQNPWLQISLWPQQQSPQRQLPQGQQQISPGLQISVLPQQSQQPNPQLPQSPPYPQLPRPRCLRNFRRARPSRSCRCSSSHHSARGLADPMVPGSSAREAPTVRVLVALVDSRRAGLGRRNCGRLTATRPGG